MEFKPVQVEDLLRGILALRASDLSSTDGRQVLKELSELAKADFRALISLVEEEGGTVQARFSVRREVLISRLLEMLPPPDEGETTPGVGRAWMLAFIAWVAEHRASSSIPSSDTGSVLLDALRHDHVAQAFAVLFAPDRTDTAGALRLWGSLNMTTLRFHAFGTTSYILAIRQKITDKHIALK